MEWEGQRTDFKMLRSWEGEKVYKELMSEQRLDGYGWEVQSYGGGASQSVGKTSNKAELWV